MRLAADGYALRGTVGCSFGPLRVNLAVGAQGVPEIPPLGGEAVLQATETRRVAPARAPSFCLASDVLVQLRTKEGLRMFFRRRLVAAKQCDCIASSEMARRLLQTPRAPAKTGRNRE